MDRIFRRSERAFKSYQIHLIMLSEETQKNIDLIREAKAGDPAAQTRILEIYRGLITSAIPGYRKSKEQVDEALYDAWRAVEDFDLEKDRSIKNAIFTYVRNGAIDRYRARDGSQEVSIYDERLRLDKEDDFLDLIGRESDPSSAMEEEGEEFQNEIVLERAYLTDRQRDAFRLKMEGLDIEEIRDKLKELGHDINYNTTAQTLFFARRKVRAVVDDETRREAVAKADEKRKQSKHWVYEMEEEALNRFGSSRFDIPERKLAFSLRIAGTRRLRAADMESYGISDEDAEIMLATGVMKKTNVSWQEWLSAINVHRYHTDPEYKKSKIEILNKAREKVDREVLRKNIKKAQDVKSKPIKRRRNRLLKEMIIPVFGIEDERGERVRPAEVSIQDVVDELRNYPRILSAYPKDVYAAVMHDLQSLGISTPEKGPRISKSLRRRLAEDSEMKDRAIERATHATEVRRQVYEKDPEKEKEAYRNSAKTRKRKYAEDPKFRKSTKKNLSKGRKAFDKKYESDPEFRERVNEKRRKTLAKGLRTSKLRASRRRDALRAVIEARFGNPQEVSAGYLIEYLSEKRPALLRRHY